jgi:hypothetical protein
VLIIEAQIDPNKGKREVPTGLCGLNFPKLGVDAVVNNYYIDA